MIASVCAKSSAVKKVISDGKCRMHAVRYWGLHCAWTPAPMPCASVDSSRAACGSACQSLRVARSARNDSNDESTMTTRAIAAARFLRSVPFLTFLQVSCRPSCKEEVVLTGSQGFDCPPISVISILVSALVSASERQSASVSASQRPSQRQPELTHGWPTAWPLPRHRTMLSRVLVRGHGTVAKQRRDLLLNIYAPLSKLDKTSAEYQELALSGRAWEDYHQPADSEKQGYTRLQQVRTQSFIPAEAGLGSLQFQENTSLLEEIDRIKDSTNPPASLVAQQLVSDYVCQSAQTEGYHIKPKKSHSLYKYMVESFFTSLHMPSLSIHELASMRLPNVTDSHHDVEQHLLTALRNDIVVSQWITETASESPGTAGLGEQDIRALAAVHMKGLDKYDSGQWTLGGRDLLSDDYRVAPFSLRSNPLGVFPYPVEVPACMRRFFQWRDRAHGEKKLHPLILACQAISYLLHIHPFPDGNGTISRMVMLDYMVRQGYLPAVLQTLEPQDYVTMIREAQNGQPDELVLRVLTSQLEALQTIKAREWESP